MTTSQNLLPIGRVAKLSNTPATTLRYYEKRGLIKPPTRVGGKRRYAADVLGRLMVIKYARLAGLSLDDIAIVLADAGPDRSQSRAIGTRQIAHIDQQISV